MIKQEDNNKETEIEVHNGEDNEEMLNYLIKEYGMNTKSLSKVLEIESSFLDNFNETGYYFYYEIDKLTTLDLESLSIVKEKAEQYLIYADNCLLDKDYMLNNNIIFKKIPRDIKRF